MKRLDFESLFPDQKTKDDVLSMLDSSLSKLTEEEKERWYESAAKLFATLDHDYVNFKVNLANSLDDYVALRYTLRRQFADEQQVMQAFFNVTNDVNYYVQVRDSTFTDPAIINRVIDIVYEMKKRNLYFEGKIEELEDKKTIFEIKQASSNNLQQISFAYQPKKMSNYVYKKLKSAHVLGMFQDCFINYFTNKWLTTKDVVELKVQIDKCKQGKKKLLHEGVKEIYKVFAVNKLLKFDSPKDTYMMGIVDNGLYPSLKGDVSLWILNLLKYLNLYDKKISYKTRKEKIDIISNLMKDNHPYNWNNSPVDEDWKYFI